MLYDFLIRCMVGVVFVSEGVQKFLFPAAVGAGRFLKIGIPYPEITAYAVGGVEIVCGLLVLLGIGLRGAVLPLLAIMAVALVTTKLPILQNEGFWRMAHESRTDYAMVMGCLYLWLTAVWPQDGQKGGQIATLLARFKRKSVFK